MSPLRPLVWIAVVVVLYVLPSALPTQYFTLLLQTAAYDTIVVVGLNLLVGFSGQISLGHAGFFAIGAYTTSLLTTSYGLSLWLTLPAAGAFAGAAGFLLALPAIRTKGLYLAMITVGFGFVVEILAQRWVDLTGGTMGIYAIPQPFGPVGYFYLVVGVAVALQLAMNHLTGSLWGKTLLALKGSEEAAQSVGIRVVRWKVVAFGVSAVYAGIGGAFFGHQNGYINSDSFTFGASLYYLVALVIGGVGSNYGPVVGTVFLAFITHFSAGLYEQRFFLLGGLLLTSGNPPEFQVSRWLIVGLAAAMGAFVIFVLVNILRIRRMPAQVGVETAVGRIAVVRSPLDPTGFVFIDGEYWSAECEEGTVQPGERVLITEVHGLKLKVKRQQPEGG